MPQPLRALALASAFVLSAFPNTSSASTIGFYTDESGTTCSFAGNAPGMFPVYVIIKPDAQGIRNVQFAAPVPACMGATHVYDAVPEGMSSAGSSPTGIALSYPFCADVEALALTINYYRSGSTTPCCEFPIVAHPSAGTVEGTDCSFNTVTMAAGSGRFNADPSCPCGEPIPAPNSPNPPDNAPTVALFAELSWLPAETEFDIANYDLYLGTDPVPPLFATVTEASYQPQVPWQELTQYYWRIVVRGEIGTEVSGPTWTFTTRALNSPPSVPVYTAPADGATGVPVIGVLLKWNPSTELDGEQVLYDVYFGAPPDPPLVTTTTQSQYAVGALPFSTTFAWKIVARDPNNLTASGPIATFTTRPQNFPPNAPFNPSPFDLATLRPLNNTLTWSASDPDPGQTLTYTVYFGTTTTPPLFVSGLTTPSRNVTCVAGTDYYWRVLARDNLGGETLGPLWTFRTNANPNVASSPSPAHGTTGVSLNPLLTWVGGDPDGQAVTYDLYWGTGSPPLPKELNIGSPSYLLHTLDYDQTIYWRILARDSQGFTTMGPIWSFSTLPNTAPAQATDPVPANNSYAGETTMLQWADVDDPEQTARYVLYFGTTDPPPYAIVTWQSEFETGPFEQGVQYYWRVDVTDGLATTPGEPWTFFGGSQPTAVAPAPTVLTLGRNHPNPFNPQTVIPYGVPNSNGTARVRLAIYDSSGRLVRVLIDDDQPGGTRSVLWRGDDATGRTVTSGVYFCVLDSGGERRTQKMVLLK